MRVKKGCAYCTQLEDGYTDAYRPFYNDGQVAQLVVVHETGDWYLSTDNGKSFLPVRHCPWCGSPLNDDSDKIHVL